MSIEVNEDTVKLVLIGFGFLVLGLLFSFLLRSIGGLLK